jgi:hypothetical protein
MALSKTIARTTYAKRTETWLPLLERHGASERIRRATAFLLRRQIGLGDRPELSRDDIALHVDGSASKHNGSEWWDLCGTVGTGVDHSGGIADPRADYCMGDAAVVGGPEVEEGGQRCVWFASRQTTSRYTSC